ncbi:hypothetical protein QX233_00675 [Chryseobacterium gambrini]|uniref:Uncharacterized protein n=1 Tax=Chryseobacterium gambrini TaxID=373672 RepID=A0AAJ1R001_9FLAO|nr:MULTISPECIES: hypothetical protein [Chryseobacterium]MDN4010965.1 hypothetical protein [Chryseobacterium gambrini]MDN4028421.1 hypothetical protein [Chryseobacterium gambrini]QWA38908.1 hypothetical protein KKI44_01480 [Chryseobacterium sp. ZHDP1]
MIKKIIEVDNLMQQIASKYRLETLNKERIENLWEEETLGIMKQAVFIKDDAYFYFLSQYGGCNIYGDGFDIGIFGFDDWLNPSLLTTPLLNDADIYLLADQDHHDEIIFYGYHATQENENSIWVSIELESGYKPVYKDFTDFLQYILTIEDGE